MENRQHLFCSRGCHLAAHKPTAAWFLGFVWLADFYLQLAQATVGILGRDYFLVGLATDNLYCMYIYISIFKGTSDLAVVYFKSKQQDSLKIYLNEARISVRQPQGD